MIAQSTHEKEILAKARRGEQLTQEEQNRLFSRTAAPGLTYAERYGGNDADSGYEGGTVSSERGEDTGYGDISGAAVGTGMGVAGLPGGRTTGGLVNDALSGRSPADTVAGLGINATRDALSAVGGPFGAVANAAIGTALSDDPGRALSSSLGSLPGSVVGGLAGGPFGAMVGGFVGSALGNAAYGSFRDGYLGDAIDSRSFEGYRDTLEDMGMTRAEVQNRAEQLAHAEALSREQSATPSSNMHGTPSGLIGRNMESMGGVQDGLGGATVGNIDANQYGRDEGGAPTGTGGATMGTNKDGLSERGDSPLGKAASEGWGDFGGGGGGDAPSNDGGDMDGTGNGGTGGVMA